MPPISRSLGRWALLLARRGPASIQTRQFAATPLQFLPNEPNPPAPPRETRPEDLPSMPEYSPDLLSKEERSMYDMLSPEERAQFDAENTRRVQEFNDPETRKAAFAELDKEIAQLDKQEPLRFEEPKTKVGMWAEDEEDEFGIVEDADEEFNEDEITSMAHAEVELHREIREYARITAWDMPLLSKLAKPFTLPPDTHILRFRYTTYMGEFHPAESKVVVELASKDLVPNYLTEAQRQTFLKLVGPRYNPQTDIVRMSSEKFQQRAQNKRYLGDLVNSLLKEAKEGDSFADVPLDLRHHKPKTRLRFPEEWKMTEERRQQLEARRRERKQKFAEEGRLLVNGNVVVQQAVLQKPALNPALQGRATQEREKVAARVGAKRIR